MKLTLAQWDRRYTELLAAGLKEPWYGGPLRRHQEAGDTRLDHLRFHDSAAALRLWNFLLTEEQRLQEHRKAGHLIVGTLKDLGTVPIMVYALPNAVAFYPDGAWWLPCVQQLGGGQLAAADRLGAGERLCPVRALLGSLELGTDFPEPDLFICPVGATCDDLSAISQRLTGMGRQVFWWNLPHRRAPDPGENVVTLPGGCQAPSVLVQHVAKELGRVRDLLATRAGVKLGDSEFAASIHAANAVRQRLIRLRETRCLPALEHQIAEMLAVHYCSDRPECQAVLDDLCTIDETPDPQAIRTYWVNPVADLAAMNVLEDLGGRLVGSEFLFPQAIDLLPEDIPPLEALARAALADPMAGPASQRAQRIVREALAAQAELVVVSRIPGASHCPFDARAIARTCATHGLQCIEVEVPPLIEGVSSALCTRLSAAFEIAQERRT